MCTQQRHASAWRTQTYLDSNLSYLKDFPSGGSMIPQARKVSDRSISSTESNNSIKIIEAIEQADSKLEPEVISDNDDVTERGASAAPSIPETEVMAVTR
jgi:hypothetical protein